MSSTTNVPYELVGISGKAGSGKDYLATHYFKNMGYQTLSFAWLLKWVCIAQGGCTWEEAFHTKPKAVRSLLQDTGNAWRSQYDMMAWVRGLDAVARTLAESHGTTKFVIADVRFPNELLAVKQLGGETIRIVAPTRVAANGLTDAQRADASEVALDATPNSEFSFVVYNDPGEPAIAQLERRYGLLQNMLPFANLDV
jgi:hypothetical protein